jgi:hypothetical protein
MRPLFYPAALLVVLRLAANAVAGEVVVDLGDSRGVTYVGALARWDEEGKARTPVDPKAKIDRPDRAISARRGDGGRWVFRDLPPGRYDLVILAGRVRVEGFHYPPILEFDPFLPPTAEAPAAAREAVIADAARVRHYENKVKPLFLAGNDKQVRLLVQLVRDRETSYDAEYGAPVATIRHEVWQYTNRHGGWVKERATRVLDRILLPRAELRRWSWVWEPRLGGFEVTEKSITIRYRLPERFDPEAAHGWFGE